MCFDKKEPLSPLSIYAWPSYLIFEATNSLVVIIRAELSETERGREESNNQVSNPSSLPLVVLLRESRERERAAKRVASEAISSLPPLHLASGHRGLHFLLISFHVLSLASKLLCS